MTARKTLASQLPAVAGRPRTVPALPPTFSKRAGVTLIELLVVISVLLILTAVAVPLIQPLLAGREVREAARMVNTYLAAAQSRAVEIGRPVGVWIERGIRDPTKPGDPVTSPGASLQLFIAEVPPPYAGDSVDARATIDPNDYNFTATPKTALAVLNAATSTFMGTLNIGPGDFIKFDYRGPLYPIVPGPNITFDITTYGPPYTGNTVSVPYQIFRRPRKTSAAPLQLPTSTVIDLRASGIGAGIVVGTSTPGFEFAPINLSDGSPVVITFAPNGRIDYAYYASNVVPQRVLGSIHLLIGRLDQIGTHTNLNLNDDMNLSDLENRWVSISHTTGNVATSENGVDDDGDGTTTLAEARLFALDKLGMGGR